MTFAPKYTFESVACPGVVVTLGRMGPKRRAATELQVAGARSKYRLAIQEAEKAYGGLQAALDAIPGYRDSIKALPHNGAGKLAVDIPQEILDMITPEAMALSLARQDAQEKANAIARSEIHPAFLVAAIQSIDGVDSAVPYTAEMVCEFGPDELFDELVEVVNDATYITKEKSSNLPLPTTSGAPVDGGPTNTSAQTAK